jgi:two-component system NtrC family sensor kinase
VVGIFLSGIIGVRLIGTTIVKQAQGKVRLDLNSAREVYNEETNNIKNVVRLTATRFFLKDAILTGNMERLKQELCNISEKESLDILTLTDRTGRVIVRACNALKSGDEINDNIVRWALTHQEPVVATEIVSAEELALESAELAERARIELIPTPKAVPRAESEETSGMVIKAAAPVFDYEEKLIAIIYGGKLLNRNFGIVDKVKDIVYRGEQYKTKDIGTATIFQGDLRISTNVRRRDGERAIGTRVSQEVYDQVLIRGVPWIGRAFVVNDWYITAYEPIKNINDEIIGMLYVGMLEKPYVDLRNRVIFTFLGIAFLSVILLSIIAYYTTTNISKPIKELVVATQKVSEGDLSHHVRIQSKDEIGQLADSFNEMTFALQKATDNYLSLTRTLEEKVKEKTKELEAAQDQLIQTEKLTSLGKLAAGIAHEINNPLTAILINSHLLKEKLKDNENFIKKLSLIIDETARCSKIVQGLLDFARQTPPEKKLADINELIEKTLLLFESHILVHDVEIHKELSTDLPGIMVDSNKIKQVFTNIILNALDAMPDGGILSISSSVAPDEHHVQITFTDTGCGIPEQDLRKIFDPFFTTKGIKGTGLGLSVSYGIIQQHDGTIDVQSTVDKGTTIIINLPINMKKQAKN